MARINLKFWWRTPLLYALPGFLMLQSIELLLLYVGSPHLTLAEYTEGVFVSLPSTALLFALALRLPDGRRVHPVSYELLALGGELFILYIGVRMILLFHEQGQTFHALTTAEQQLFAQADWQNATPVLFPQLVAALAILSYMSIRLLVRPYRFWNRMRDKRLVWEITHAQMGGLVLMMVLLFFVTVIDQVVTLLSQIQAGIRSSIFIYDVFVGVLALAIIVGILTAIMVMLISVPAIVISYRAARRITQRIDTLVEATHNIRQGHYEIRIPVMGKDEITQLQENFNIMVDQLAASHIALETERDTVSSLLQSRRKLFADISHELRTPVATIRSYLESSAPDVDIMRREIIQLQYLIDDIFTLARSDFDQLEYHIALVDLKPILERTAQVAKQLAWQTHKVEVILKLPAESPIVLADGARVEQILYNLLHNAIRHTLPGGLIIVRACTEAQFVCMEIQDTGEGISEEHLAHIWERFYRTPETRSSDAQGVGLGLALVREMTETMHGKVDVQSKVGQGSCFRIWLPRSNENRL